MKRKITEDLMKWMNDGCRRPYMVIGARQVGKTFIINDFCKKYFTDYIYINLEKDKEVVAIFEESIDPDTIIRQLGFLYKKPIDINSTAIFIDEVQVSEKAIVSLKYFAEHEGSFKIIVAGSLLGVALNRFSSSFPVGRIQRKYMYPMDFEEFLWALGQEDLAEEIRLCFKSYKAMFSAVHDKLIGYYKDYLYVGGMPASVLSYIEAIGDLNHYEREIKRDIIEDYIADMKKYTTNEEAIKVKDVYQSIPNQLGRDNNKFSYKLVSSKGKKAVYGTSIDWLLSGKLVHKATMVENPGIPLLRYHKESMFKIYMGDTGLLTEMADMSPYDMQSEGSRLFTGMLTENYVAQSFASSGSRLYYWRSGNIAEIDFLLNIKGQIIPVEVKASTNTKSKALKTYIDKYNPAYSIKVSARNFGSTDSIKSIPLYAAHLINNI